MRVALVVCAKELRLRLRDRTAIVLAFVAPTVIAAIVTGAFGSGFGPGRFRTTIAVHDADGSDLSRAFSAVLRSPQLRDQVTVLRAGTDRAARSLVDGGEAASAVVAPRGFEADVTAGRRAKLLVYRSASDVLSGEIAQAIASGFVDQINATRIAIFTAARTTGRAPTPELVRAAARERIPIRLRDVTTAPATHVSGANYFAPGTAIFFLFFTVGAGARSLLAEREQGTMPRVLAAPAGPGSIVLGKAAAMFVLGLVSMTVVYLFTGVLFSVDWGDPLAIGVLTLAVVLAVMSVTALVQTLARTEQQAASYGSVVGLVLSLVGGNFFPLFQMPAFVQRLSALTPNGWALRGFTDIAYDGAGLSDLVPHIAAIGAFVAVCGTLAALRARKITLA